MIKQNIKMRVAPEQSRKVQEICFANGIEWAAKDKVVQHIDKPFLFIDEHLTFMRKEEEEGFLEEENEEVSAELFIRTNGTREDISLNDKDTEKYESKNYQGTEAELLLSKMIDFKDEELEKHTIKIDNQKKQLEKYVVKIANQKEELTRLLNQKEELQGQLNMANSAVGSTINNNSNLVKLLEEKDAIIKYLENKLDI